jgi:hypothetical protein
MVVAILICLPGGHYAVYVAYIERSLSSMTNSQEGKQ